MVSRIALFTAILAIALPVHAQFLGTQAVGEPVRLSLFPDVPEPGEVVRATLESATVDLDRAQIVWLVDGTRQVEEDGQKSILITLPPLGRSTTITARVESIEVPGMELQRTLTPGEVDLIWESTSYAPPLYRGKKLASPASSIRVEALARIPGSGNSRIAPQNLVYTWRKNGAIVGSASGRGKSRATFPAPLLFGSDTLSVEVTSLDESRVARKEVRIPSTDPFALLYQDHPLFGVLYHSAIVNESAVSDIEATFTAVPYFSIGTSPRDPEFSYLWEVNGRSILTDPEDPNRITVNAQGTDGRVALGLNLTHARDWFMSAESLWNITLGSGRGILDNPFTNNPFSQ